MEFDTRQYMIFAASEIDMIDFSEVLETSPDTCRYSVDETKTFVKWDGQMPECVAALTTAEGPYSHAEILEILSGDDWVDDEEVV
jgi:hypothetical protein